MLITWDVWIRRRERGVVRSGKAVWNRCFMVVGRCVMVWPIEASFFLLESCCSCCCCTSGLRIMPNGHREPYRLGEGCPSPCHTSDSEESWHHKKRYTFLARKYTRKWRRHVAWRKQSRRLKTLLRRKNLSPEVLEMIAAFLA